MSLVKAASAKLDPRRAMPRHYIGQMFERRGDYDRAGPIPRTARALEPREPRFHVDLASLAPGARAVRRRRPAHCAAGRGVQSPNSRVAS